MKDYVLETFQIYLKELEKIESKLSEQYALSTNLYDHKVGVYKIFRKLVINLRFVNDTVHLSSQQISLSLTRMIVDQYSILYLLSRHSNRQEQLLRYYLYMIDSLQCRIRTIEDFSSQLKNNPDDVMERNMDAMTHDANVILKIQTAINDLGLFDLTSQKNIDERNWKYKSDNGKKYSWEELYRISKIPPHFAKAIQNHFSTFTHGLGMTILYSDDNPNATIYAYDFLNLIQALAGKLMIVNYTSELHNLKFNYRFTELADYIWRGLNK